MPVYKRGDTWTAVFDIGKDEITGKRRQKTKGGFKLKKDAEKYLNEMERQVYINQYVEEKNITFCDAFQEWLDMKKPKLAPKTYEQYEYFYRVHFEPYFKKALLCNIKMNTIEKYYNYKIGDLSNTTINTQHRILKQFFKYTIKNKLRHDNPAEYAEVPSKDHKDMLVWNILDINRAIELFMSTTIYMHVLLAIWTGLREGEICGLRWEDIDFSNKILTVKYTQQRVSKKHNKDYIERLEAINASENAFKEMIALGDRSGNADTFEKQIAADKSKIEEMKKQLRLDYEDIIGLIRFKRPKTSKSFRKVVLTDFVVNLLKAVKKEQILNRTHMGETYIKDYDGFVSVWEDGSFKEADYVGKKFAKVLKQQNRKYEKKKELGKLTPVDHLIPIIRFHDLRHTHATLLVGQGKHMKSISERLGHTQIGITMDLYSHVSVDMQTEMITGFDQVVLNLPQDNNEQIEKAP